MGILKQLIQFIFSILFPNNDTVYLKHRVTTMDETDKWILTKHPEYGSVSSMRE